MLFSNHMPYSEVIYLRTGEHAQRNVVERLYGKPSMSVLNWFLKIWIRKRRMLELC
jgi:hypothetical protein